jgi:hypothetical protein
MLQLAPRKLLVWFGERSVGDGVYIIFAAGGLASLQCLEATRIGISKGITCKNLHENSQHEGFLNVHMHASGE